MDKEFFSRLSFFKSLPTSRLSKSLAGYFVKGQGEACKRGETSSRTGCTPKSGEAKTPVKKEKPAPKGKKAPKEEEEGSESREVTPQSLEDEFPKSVKVLKNNIKVTPWGSKAKLMKEKLEGGYKLGPDGSYHVPLDEVGILKKILDEVFPGVKLAGHKKKTDEQKPANSKKLTDVGSFLELAEMFPDLVQKNNKAKGVYYVDPKKGSKLYQALADMGIPKFATGFSVKTTPMNLDKIKNLIKKNGDGSDVIEDKGGEDEVEIPKKFDSAYEELKAKHGDLIQESDSKNWFRVKAANGSALFKAIMKVFKDKKEFSVKPNGIIAFKDDHKDDIDRILTNFKNETKDKPKEGLPCGTGDTPEKTGCIPKKETTYGKYMIVFDAMDGTWHVQNMDTGEIVTENLTEEVAHEEAKSLAQSAENKNNSPSITSLIDQYGNGKIPGVDINMFGPTGMFKLITYGSSHPIQQYLLDAGFHIAPGTGGQVFNIPYTDIFKAANILKEFKNKPKEEVKKPNGLLTNSIVDVSSWDESAASKWASNKMHMMEQSANSGDWDQFKKNCPPFVWNPSSIAAGDMSQEAKAIKECYDKLLLKKAAHDSVPQDASSWAESAPAPTTPPKPAPPSSPKLDGTIGDMDGWQVVGSQLGSNKGGQYLAPDGKKYYVKFLGESAAKNEVLTAKLYEVAGAGVPNYNLIQTHKGLGTASEWIDSAKSFNHTDPIQKEAAIQNFGIHAWLGNWDAIGASFDNQIWIDTPSGKQLYTVDTGGGLDSHAQAVKGKKPFGPKVDELKNMVNSSVNSNAAAVFGDMSPQQTLNSLNKVLNVSDEAIEAMVNKYGPGDDSSKKDLIGLLKLRKKHIQEVASKLEAQLGKKPTPDVIAPTPKEEPAATPVTGESSVENLSSEYEGIAVPSPNGGLTIHAGKNTPLYHKLHNAGYMYSSVINGFSISNVPEYLKEVHGILSSEFSPKDASTPKTSPAPPKNVQDLINKYGADNISSHDTLPVTIIKAPTGSPLHQALKKWEEEHPYEGVTTGNTNGGEAFLTNKAIPKIAGILEEHLKPKDTPKPALDKNASGTPSKKTTLNKQAGTADELLAKHPGVVSPHDEDWAITVKAKPGTPLHDAMKAAGYSYKASVDGFLIDKTSTDYIKEIDKLIDKSEGTKAATPTAKTAEHLKYKYPGLNILDSGEDMAIYADVDSPLYNALKKDSMMYESPTIPGKFWKQSWSSIEDVDKLLEESGAEVNPDFENDSSSTSTPASVPVPVTPPAPAPAPATPPPMTVGMPYKPKLPAGQASGNKKIDKIYEAMVKGNHAAIEAIKVNNIPANAKIYNYKMGALAYAKQLKGLPAGTTPPAATPSSYSPPPKSTPVSYTGVTHGKVDPSKFPAEPVFVSSNVANVEQNKKIVKTLLEFAHKGDLVGLEAHPVPPSQKLNDFKNQLVATIHDQLNPPAPPKVYTDHLEKLDKVFKASEALKNPNVKKVGLYLVVDNPGVIDLSFPKIELKSSGHQLAGPGEQQKHDHALVSIPAGSRSILINYTGSSYGHINNGLRSGNPDATTVKAGKEMIKHAVSLTPGTVIHRGISLAGNDLKAFLKSEGHILQEPGFSSCRITEHGYADHKNIQYHFQTTPGNKAIYMDNHSQNKGEKEMLCPPGTRYYIQKILKVGSQYHVTAFLLPTVEEQCC